MSTDPADVNRLAELDADIAAGLAADPGAGAGPATRAVLDALAATRAELASLPALQAPPELVARWTAALPPPRVDDMSTQSSPIQHAPTPPRVDETGTQVSPIESGEGPQPAPRHDPVRRALRAGGRARASGGAEDRRLGAESAGYGRERTEPVITPPTARRAGPWPGRPPAGRRRRVRPAVGVGLALAGLLVVAGVLQSRPAQPAVTAAQLGGVARAAVGAHDAGELADPARRAGCLRSAAAPGLDPGAALLGGRGIEFEGRPGILLLFGTGELGRFRVVVVNQECGPAGGTLLADAVVGR